MKISWLRTFCVLSLLPFAALLVTPAQQQTTTSRIVSTANTFLSALDQKQRQAVLFSFNDQEQRKRWSNFPVMMTPEAVSA